MSLFWHVPGFPSYKYDTREGDTQFFKDIDDATGKSRFLVIDGATTLYCYKHNPGSAQKQVNSVINLAKDVLSGKKDYGKDKDRINRIDKELGKGFGQLVQDYINVLCGVRKSV